MDMIKDIIAEAEVGKIYKGIVKKVVEFGAFVGILPNQDGLLHVSEIAHERVQNVSDYLKEGDEVEVKVLEIDRMGKVRLSRKVLLAGGPAAPTPGSAGSQDSGHGGSEHRGGRDDRRGGGHRR
jgi:polyribonucleotide nucleotidyltransferase